MILPFKRGESFPAGFFLEYNYSIKSILTRTHYSPDNAESRWRRSHTHAHTHQKKKKKREKGLKQVNKMHVESEGRAPHRLQMRRAWRGSACTRVATATACPAAVSLHGTAAGGG